MSVKKLIYGGKLGGGVNANDTIYITPMPEGEVPVPGLSDLGILLLIALMIFFGILKMRKTPQPQLRMS